MVDASLKKECVPHTSFEINCQLYWRWNEPLEKRCVFCLKAEGIRQLLMLKFWLYGSFLEMPDFFQSLLRSQVLHLGLRMLPLGFLFIGGVPQLFRSFFDLDLSLSVILMKLKITDWYSNFNLIIHIKVFWITWYFIMIFHSVRTENNCYWNGVIQVITVDRCWL